MMREKLEALDRYNGIEKDPEGVYIMRDEALAILAADVDSDMDSLGDLHGTTPQCTCGAKKGEWHKQECAVNTTSPDGNGPAQDGKPFEAEDFKEELGRWKQHKWFWSVIDDLLSKRTPQKPSELWVCSECGKEFDHRPGPHRVKYGGPLCDGTAFEKGSDRLTTISRTGAAPWWRR